MREPIQKIFDQLGEAYLQQRIGLYGFYPNGTRKRRRPDYFLVDLLPDTPMSTANKLRDYFLAQGSFECTIEPEMKADSGESYYRLRAWFRN